MTLFLALALLTEIKAYFVAHMLFIPFGVAGRGKASREIACIGHSVLWEP